MKRFLNPRLWPGRSGAVAIQIIAVLFAAAIFGRSSFGEWGSVYLGALLVVIVVTANILYDVGAAAGYAWRSRRDADILDR